MSNKLVFVVGCPRSGTSPFARWLQACGLEGVKDERRVPRYPAGYFEHLPILMFHKSLECLPRGADRRITTEPMLTAHVLDDSFLAESFRLAFQPVLDRQLDFVKFPQLALSIDFLFERFPDIHVIGLWRDPAVSFRSLMTRELPKEMFPASGLKAIMLWNVYAYQLVNAKRARPDDVTLLDIDAFITQPGAGPAVAERIGHDASLAVPVAEAVDPALWRSGVPLGWRVYHHAMAWLCELAGLRSSESRKEVASQSRWLRELRNVTDR